MKRTSKPKWTQEEIDLLVQNRMPVGRSNKGCSVKKRRLGIRPKGDYRANWPEEQIEELKRLVGQGYSARKISEMGVWSQSRNAIQKMMCRIGLAKRKKTFKFPMEVKEKFKSFLLKNWEGKTPEELLEIWNKENARFPSGKSKVVHYLTKLGVKISYGEVQRIKALRRKEERIASERTSSAVDEIKRERIRMMRARAEKNRDIWTGMNNPEEQEESTFHGQIA